MAGKLDLPALRMEASNRIGTSTLPLFSLYISAGSAIWLVFQAVRFEGASPAMAIWRSLFRDFSVREVMTSPANEADLRAAFAKSLRSEPQMAAMIVEWGGEKITARTSALKPILGSASKFEGDVTRETDGTYVLAGEFRFQNPARFMLQTIVASGCTIAALMVIVSMEKITAGALSGTAVPGRIWLLLFGAPAFGILLIGAILTMTSVNAWFARGPTYQLIDAFRRLGTP